jgi:hypothetical protein
MKLIGHSNSDRQLYFLKIDDWINHPDAKITPLTPEDMFDGYCLMEHLVTYYLRENDDLRETAQEYAEEYHKYLVNNLLWEKLIKGRDVTIPLAFAKLGKGLALEEFK